MPTHAHSKSVTKGQRKCSGGPLKRKDENWDRIIGPSIDVIPGCQLPQIRTILQRYRALRIENEFTETVVLAKVITDEILPIWGRAGVPTVVYKNCVLKVEQAITSYTQLHNASEVGGNSPGVNL